MLTQRLEDQRREHVDESARLESEKRRVSDKLSEKMVLVDQLATQLEVMVHSKL